jgi:hypothetical protein
MLNSYYEHSFNVSEWFMSQSLLRLAAGSLLMSVAMCASAGPNKNTASQQDFTLSGVLQEVPGPSARCPSNFGGTIAGFGDSNVLGKVAFLSSDCITPNGSGFTFSAGHFMITTMTGELVFADYSGQFVPTGVGSNFVFSNATFQVTGGTGRYAKASGGGDLTGTEDMTTGKGTIQLTGRVLFK